MGAIEYRKTSFFDRQIGAPVFSILPGEHLVIKEAGSAVGTLLGSCVSACIRDRRSGTGGLNHFLLPGEEQARSARYGAYAMEVLINDILSQGARRSDLEAKVFGGAALVTGAAASGIGAKNGRFVCEFLRAEGIRVLACDLGGDRARKLFYFPDTGHARVRYLSGTESRAAAATEARLERALEAQPKAGGVELF